MRRLFSIRGLASAGATRSRGACLLLAATAAVYFTVILNLNVLQGKALFLKKGVDQTYLTESLVNTVHGHFFHQTHAITNLGGWGLMDHFWPVLLLFIPLAAIFQSVTVLYVINALCLTATGIAIFFIARDSFENDWLALLSTVVFWSMPEIYYCSITGSWPEVWAMPFLAFMFLFYFRRRPVAFSIVSILFMACMEQMLVYVLLFSVLELMSRRDRKWILLPAGLAMLWVAVLVLWADSLGSGRFFTHTFNLHGTGLLDFLRSLFLDLNRSPLLYLALLWPPLLLFSLPPTIIFIGWDLNLDLIPGNEGHLRYIFFVFLFMAVGGIRALRLLTRSLDPRLGIPARRIATVCLMTVLAFHLLALARMAPAEIQRFTPRVSAELVWEVIDTLPQTARIASNCVISYAFVGRADTYVEFARFKGSEFMVWEFFFDERNLPKGAWLAEDRYRAMGRHTPSLFILDGEGGNYTVAKGLWADPRFPFTTVRCADVDGDGATDILLLGSDGRGVVYKASDTNGFDFEEDPTIRELKSFMGSMPLTPRKINTPGVDRALGDQWLVRLGEDRATITVGRAGSPGTPVTEYRLGGYLEEILVDDLNADGMDDVVAIDSRRYLIWILMGGPQGRLDRTAPIDAPPIPYSLATADLDDDGDLEILVTKFQRLPNMAAFDRFLNHEHIDHVFWDFAATQKEMPEHFRELPDWSVVVRGDRLYAFRTRDTPN